MISLLINVACAHEEINQYEEKLAWLENADAESDSADAIEQGDFRLKCVMGFALRCPGVKDRNGRSYTIIEGTGDVVTSERHLNLLKLASKYASDYNGYIEHARKTRNAE